MKRSAPLEAFSGELGAKVPGKAPRLDCELIEALATPSPALD